MYKRKIDGLIKERNKILGSKFENRGLYGRISEKIYRELYKGRNKLPADYILETLSDLGIAPCLVNDDNGHFALSDEGIQSLPRNFKYRDDIDMKLFIKKKYWKNSVREAISYYLEELVE